MQNIIYDMYKLPLTDRLEIIEQLICSIKSEDVEKALIEIIEKQIKPTYQ